VKKRPKFPVGNAQGPDSQRRSGDPGGGVTLGYPDNRKCLQAGLANRGAYVYTLAKIGGTAGNVARHALFITGGDFLWLIGGLKASSPCCESSGP